MLLRNKTTFAKVALAQSFGIRRQFADASSASPLFLCVICAVMQNHFDQSPHKKALIASTSRHGSVSGSAAADKSSTSTLPSVSFSSCGGHEQEYKEESGIYMITMASVSAASGLDSEHDSQTQATLTASKTVASVTSAVSAGAPHKTTKRLIFQLDDQQRDTFDLEEKV